MPFCGNETIEIVHNVIFLPEDFNLEIGSKASQEHPDVVFFFSFIILLKKSSNCILYARISNSTDHAIMFGNDKAA